MWEAFAATLRRNIRCSGDFWEAFAATFRRNIRCSGEFWEAFAAALRRNIRCSWGGCAVSAVRAFVTPKFSDALAQCDGLNGTGHHIS